MRLLRTLGRVAVWTFAVLVLLFAACLPIFRWPQPLFRFSVTTGNFTLYSDTLFEDQAGSKLLGAVRDSLSASPLYDSARHYNIFICNTRWRRTFFFNRKYRAGGLSYYPITDNVFLRDALIEQNRMRTTSGGVVPGDRPLDYFVAHELTHTLVGHAVGPIRYWRLPVWIREGYADYVGKGRRFDYGQARRAFLAQARDLDPARSGLYLRYHLLVAHYLDRQQWTVQDLLTTALSQRVAEEAVRADTR